MSTQPQLNQPGASPGTDLVSKCGDEAVEAALRQRQPCAEKPLARDPLIVGLPVEIDIAVPIRNFRVGNLLALAEGQVVTSQWDHGDDVPMTARGTPLAWTEFEAIETKLAVRITRLD